MLLNIDLQYGTTDCSFRSGLYALLMELGYNVVNTGYQFLKVDTTNKTAVEVKDRIVCSVDSKYSLSSLRQLLNTP